MIRFAIWAAVSTEAQAASDKVSIQEQQLHCRQAAQARGWREAAGPFVVPGESRTRWVNLRDAEQAIPQLHSLLDAAQSGQFDVLVLYDYNRLRDLLDPVSKTLTHYNVQIFSVSQPVEPMAPAEYSPYATDTANIMQGMSRIISQAQIADLRRKYRYAMPRRAAERGLPVQIPFGYRKPPGRETDRNAVPIQDPIRANLLLKARDMLLAGQSLSQIAEMLVHSGEPPPRGRRWYPQSIRDMLRNPFYAGFVRWGMSASRLDPRTGKRSRDRNLPPQKSVVARGRHTPLWDEPTHQALIAELARRSKKYPGKRTSQFSSLLVCGICGQKLWAFYNANFKPGPYTPEQRVWRCSSRKPHVAISQSDAIQQITAELKQALHRPASYPSTGTTTVPDYRGQITELKERRQRLEDAYLVGTFSLQAFTGRAADLDRQIAELENDISFQTIQQVESVHRLEAIGNLKGLLETIPDYLTKGDPQEINHILFQLIREIVIGANGEIEIKLKG